MTGVLVAEDPGVTTQVVFTAPCLAEEYNQTVYVHLYTADVQGQLTTWFGSTPVVTWLDGLHRTLNLGEAGSLYSELSANWLWVISLADVVLWFARRRTARRASASQLSSRHAQCVMSATRKWCRAAVSASTAPSNMSIA